MADLALLLAAARQALHHSPVDIASSANPRYRHLQALLTCARERRRHGQTVLEGWHLLGSWLDSGRPVRQLVLPRRTWQHLEQCVLSPDVSVPDAVLAAPWLILEDRLFGQLDIQPSPSPLLAVVDIPRPVPLAWLNETAADRPASDLLILDRIQDPGNVGALLRTAAAAGIPCVLATAGTAACWAPKVLRAGMGGHFALSIHEGIELATLQQLARQMPLAGTVLQAGSSLYQADLRQRLAWVFGNEGEGIDPTLQPLLACRLTIPQTSAVESLNVAASAAICLFEQRRQRLASAASGP